jgi:hypothetical protein
MLRVILPASVLLMLLLLPSARSQLAPLAAAAPSACHAPPSLPLFKAQHVRPKHACNNRAKIELNQVKCSCQREVDCKSGKVPPDLQCASYCYEDMCLCTFKPCP